MRFQPVIKWIGSKRHQSEEIIKYFPNYIDTYYEPFCGGCSVIYQLLEMNNINDDRYINKIVCSDINGDLIDLWNTIKNDPQGLLDEYTRMWNEMNLTDDKKLKKKYFECIRDDFNNTRSPYMFFFLMRTVTNGVPRYNRFGEFNNTFHYSRDGMKPSRLNTTLSKWHHVLSEYDVEFRRCDYNEILNEATEGDFIYMDPPFELTRSTGKYFGNIDYENLFDRLRILNEKNVKFALSFENDEYLMIPDDCYENKIDIKSTYGGFLTTRLNMDKSNVFESLYLN